MLTVLRDADQVAVAAADRLTEAVRGGATAVGLATGSSPQGAYRELAVRVRSGRLSLGRCSGHLLDEYVGLPAGHPQTYREVIRRDLVDHVDLDPSRVRGPDGNASDLAQEACRYEQQVVGAGVEVQVLGLGRNGHIGFNEPGSALDSVTRVVTLSERTRVDNARFFVSADEVPTQALTQGLSTILRAESVLLLVTGQQKAAALAAALTGPVSPDCPGSVLQRHPQVEVIADTTAASALPSG